MIVAKKKTYLDVRCTLSIGVQVREVNGEDRQHCKRHWKSVSLDLPKNTKHKHTKGPRGPKQRADDTFSLTVIIVIGVNHSCLEGSHDKCQESLELEFGKHFEQRPASVFRKTSEKKGQVSVHARRKTKNTNSLMCYVIFLLALGCTTSAATTPRPACLRTLHSAPQKQVTPCHPTDAQAFAPLQATPLLLTISKTLSPTTTTATTTTMMTYDDDVGAPNERSELQQRRGTHLGGDNEVTFATHTNSNKHPSKSTHALDPPANKLTPQHQILCLVASIIIYSTQCMLVLFVYNLWSFLGPISFTLFDRALAEARECTHCLPRLDECQDCEVR